MEENAYNQDLIVQYLLGGLPEDEQVRIEERAFSDSKYLQNIEAVESDLIDEYVRGGLSVGERKQFESRFLASRERQQKVEFARALAQLTDASVVTEEASPRVVEAQLPVPWWKSLFAPAGHGRPAFGFALAAASLLLVIGISWLVIQTKKQRTELARLQAEQQSQKERQSELEKQAAEERERKEELAAQLKREQEGREESESEVRRLQQELQKPAPPRKEEKGRMPAVTVASLILLPGVSRGAQGERPQLVIARGTHIARLQIGLDPSDDYQSFRVELTTRAGRAVLSRDRMQPRSARAGRALILELPANSLDAGEYELALKGINDEGRVEDIGYYYFSVVKK